MSKVSRRVALSALGLGVVAVAGCEGQSDDSPSVPQSRRTGDNPVSRENRLAGSADWKMSRNGTHPVTDTAGQIQGYASATSVNIGDSVDFHVSVRPAGHFTVAVYRLGHYGGVGARHLVTSPRLAGAARPVPSSDPATGTITCGWPVSWTLAVPKEWVSGSYLAVFTSEAGFRSYTPFVVRDDARRADFLAVVPFTTYAAYNLWPMNGRTGKSLYKGYDAQGKVGGLDYRAFEVAFDRPYFGSGLPSRSQIDRDLVTWIERSGYDVTYASSLDLHEGRIDPSHYRGLVFTGHDEYWSKPMRDVAQSAVEAGTHLVYLAANNVYWHVRLRQGSDGRDNRVMTCYKDTQDPTADTSGPTTRWRQLDADGARAEQGLLGVQYNGVVKTEVPLVVKDAGHWFWKGTGVSDGDTIDNLIGGEADGRNARMPQPAAAHHALLSASPYTDKQDGVHRIQNTSLYETKRGTLVFVAGTFNWTRALADPKHTDPRVQAATTNLFTRMLQSQA